MRNKMKFLAKEKNRMIAIALSLVMTIGLISFGIVPNGRIKVQAKDSPSIEENFNEYANADSKAGFAFGTPTLTLTDNGAEGTKGLIVGDRSQNYFGYAFNLSEFAGNTIKVKADMAAYEAEDNTENGLQVTLKTTKTGADDEYTGIATGTTLGKGFITLSGEYDVPSDCDTYELYFEGPEGVDYIIDNISIEVVGDYKEPGSTESYVDFSGYEKLKDLYKDYFKIGVSCEALSNNKSTLAEIGNEYKENLIKQQFDSITFGNELKLDYNMDYANKSGKTTEEFLSFYVNPAAKEMLDWAKDNGIPVRGHTLLWHSQCPDAVFCKEYKPVYGSGSTLDPDCLVSKETMLSRMKSYMYSTMEYMYGNGYGDVIYAWDVVNEAVELGNSANDLRNSYWYRIIGEDLLYYAFKYANEAVDKYANGAMKPKLFYNDYNEFQPAKQAAITKALSRVKEEGLIDGIGMQGHISDNNSIKDYIDSLKQYSKDFGEVHITELDVKQTSSGVNAEYNQGKFYYDFFKALIQAKKDGANLTSVTFWGLTDNNSWIKQNSPLLFKGNLETKLAFDGVVLAATGGEFPEPEFVEADYKDIFNEFDTEDDLGIFDVRGGGKLTIQSDEVFEGKYALLDSERTESWHGASFDVSKFAGETIGVSAWVKTTANTTKITANIDGSWPTVATADTSSGEWTQIFGTYKIPAEIKSLQLYIETDDKSDIYIDALRVKLVGLDEGFESEGHIATPRGTGHIPEISVVSNESKSGGHALLVKRQETDATLALTINGYIGQKVAVKAYVKTTDSKIVLGLDGDTPVEIAKTDATSDAWTLVEGVVTVPNGVKSASMYIETNGKGDFYVDDVSVRPVEYMEDLEGENSTVETRWGGAGTASKVEDGSDHAVVLTGRDESYYGLAFDVSRFIGNEVQVTFDVKTDDPTILLTGDIDQVWPNYIRTSSSPGQYKTVGTILRLPKDQSSLRLYVETDGKTDLYMDNVKVERVPVGKEASVTYDCSALNQAPIKTVGRVGCYIPKPDSEVSVWYKDAACTTPWDFYSEKLTGNTTLYAKGDKVPETETVPKITKQPNGVYTTVGQKITLKIEAKGKNLSYQWKVDRNDGKGFVVIPEATAASYTIPEVTLTDNLYKFICIVSNQGGEVTSDSAVLHVSEVPRNYDVIEGADGVYNRSNGGTYTIRANGEFDKFVDVEMDNEIVDGDNYAVTSGSTVITFTEEHMKTLSVGIHNIKVNFTDGVATTTVTIEDKEVIQTPGNGEEPKTGDQLPLNLLIALLIVSGIAAVVLFIRFKKRNVSK